MRLFPGAPTAMQTGNRKTRTIRSFVRRAGRLTDSQKRALAELGPSLIVKYAEEHVSYSDVFGRVAPVVLEIGFGNGETLVEQAASDAGRDYIGIEVHEPGVGHCLLKADEADVGNLRIIMHDAVEVLVHQVPQASLDRLNLYFPDPWPKKRHHKRRIVQDRFVELVADRLCDGGAFHVATDWENYAEQMMDVLTTAEGLTNTCPPGEFAPRPDFRPLTKFELRGERLGHGVWDLLFTRDS